MLVDAVGGFWDLNPRQVRSEKLHKGFFLEMKAKSRSRRRDAKCVCCDNRQVLLTRSQVKR